MTPFSDLFTYPEILFPLKIIASFSVSFTFTTQRYNWIWFRARTGFSPARKCIYPWTKSCSWRHIYRQWDSFSFANHYFFQCKFYFPITERQNDSDLKLVRDSPWRGSESSPLKISIRQIMERLFQIRDSTTMTVFNLGECLRSHPHQFLHLLYSVQLSNNRLFFPLPWSSLRQVPFVVFLVKGLNSPHSNPLHNASLFVMARHF